MFLSESDLIGQCGTVELYNDSGRLNHLEGHLTVWLSISPTPRVHWKVEIDPETYNASPFSSKKPEILASLPDVHPQLVVKDPIFTSWGGKNEGYAKQVLYGNTDAEADYFEFYLSNTDFLREAITVIDFINLEAVKRATGRKSFSVEINETWSIELFPSEEALGWLTPEHQNTGSMITSRISLVKSKPPSTSTQDLTSWSLDEAREIFADLCWMLSYANGGYVQPIYGIAKNCADEETTQKIEHIAAWVQTPEALITSQENIGMGFIRPSGMEDLLNFIQCFPTFQRMLKTCHWKKKWIVLLEWYFQAIPRATGRRRNLLLPVVANALGALLENLARIILVHEGCVSNTQFKKLKTAKERIKKLLERIGVAGEESHVETFAQIRNNSTHPRQDAIELNGQELSEREQWDIVQRAVQWVDEVILWRLGYKGRYRQRGLTAAAILQGIQPRYDLDRRDPCW